MKKFKKVLILLLISIVVLDVFVMVFLAKDVSISFISNNKSDIEYSDNMIIKEPIAFIKGKYIFKDKKQLEVKLKKEITYYALGKNIIEYTTKFLFWEENYKETINIVDTTSPEIILETNSDIITPYGEKYKEEGFKAIDNYDGILTTSVVVEEKDGFVFYEVQDSNGNIGTAKREIIYTDINSPEIFFESDKPIYYTQGAEYKSPKYTAKDDIDGDLTKDVKIDTSKLDMNTVGTYEVVYSVSDKAGNTGTVTRTVIILERKETNKIPASSVESKEKVIYLTFDDGPGPYTEKLLKILDKYDVKATFFVINNKYKNLIKKEHEAGHKVAIHSFTHDYKKIYSSKNAYYDDLNKMKDVIYEQTGEYTNLVRFPGGSSNTISKKYCEGIMNVLIKSLENDGYVYFDWNVSSGDAGETTSTKQVAKNVINGIKGKKIAVVLQHDIKEFSVDAVEEIIKWGLENDYTFLTLDSTSFTAHHGVNN